MPNYGDPATTLNAIRRLVLLGLPVEVFPRWHHNGDGLVRHYEYSRDEVQRFGTQGGNIPTAKRLDVLADAAEAMLQLVPQVAQTRRIDRDLARALDLPSESDVRELPGYIWQKLGADALASHPITRREAPEGQPLPSSAGVYVLAPTTPTPMYSQKGNRASLPVSCVNTKVGEASDLRRRIGNYRGTFAREGAERSEAIGPVCYCSVPAGQEGDAQAAALAAVEEERIVHNRTKTEWLSPEAGRREVCRRVREALRGHRRRWTRYSCHCGAEVPAEEAPASRQ